MNFETARRLEALRLDRESGAVALAVSAIEIVLAAPAEDRPEAARALRRMHPAIVTVANVGRLVEGGASDAELRALRASLLEGNRRIAGHVARIAPPGAAVITLSDSATVEAALRELRPSRVLVMESHPGGEGRRLAARVGGETIPDAAMGRCVPRVACALVGIDAFDRSGAVLHKVGTLPLALCCRHFGKPFYAAGHSFKLAPGEVEALLQQAGADAPFDCTPPELITALVTEQGPRL